MCCPEGAEECEDSWEDPFDRAPENQSWGCVDTNVSRYHCGGCADTCPSDDLEDYIPGACELGVCAPTYHGCVDVSEGQRAPTCAEVCAGEDKPCSATGCGSSMRVFLAGICSDGAYEDSLDLGCDQPLPAEEIPASISCCCEN